MNEMIPGLRRRVDLRLEAPFALGRLTVSPANLEVSGRDGVETLEPRVMQVLVALHRSRGEAVSREELSDLCWEGRIVGDDALNRSISRLRKALAGDPAVSIDTVPKVGYRLRTPAAPVRPGRSEPPQAGARRGAPALVWLVLGSVVVGGAAATMLAPWRGDWQASAIRPLTRDPGVETDPALSPDGSLLAFAAGAGFGAPRDILLRGLAVGDPPLRLTQTPAADESAPAWSPDGTRLAFTREQDGHPCAVVVTSVPRGVERVVGRCEREGRTSLAWLDGRTLAFADRGPEGVRRLYALDLDSGARRALTRPPAAAVGDAVPVISPDGRWLAFRRTAALGSDDLWLLELATGDERALTTGGQKAGGFAWSADSTTLFFTGNRGGDFGLWAAPTRGGEPRRVSLGVMPMAGLTADRSNRLAVETVRTRGDLVTVDPAGAVASLGAAEGAVWDPDAGPGGALVYGADASGANEIWVRAPGAPPARLTAIGASFVHSPRWSPDGGRIAFLAVVAGATDIWSMSADGSGQRRLTRDGRRKAGLAWSDDGVLYYGERGETGWRLMALTPGGEPRAVPGGAGVAILRRAPDGRLFARRADDPAILLFEPASGRLSAPPGNPRAAQLEAWAAGADGIYALRRSEGQDALWRMDWAGHTRRVGAWAIAHRPTFTVRNDGVVVAARLVDDSIDLALLELSR